MPSLNGSISSVVRDLPPDNGSSGNTKCGNIDMFTVLCTVTADTSQLASTVMTGENANMYYRIEYSIVLLFGLTEHKAQLRWMEDVCNFLSDSSRRCFSLDLIFCAGQRNAVRTC